MEQWVDALIQQAGVNLGRGLVGEVRACRTSRTVCCYGMVNAAGEEVQAALHAGAKPKGCEGRFDQATGR